jgi:hypothetical protein
VKLFGSGRERALWIAGALVLVLILAVFFSAPEWTRHPNIAPQPAMSGMEAMADMPDMPGMQHGVAASEQTPAVLAKQLADKRESEFNHHLAGVLLILAALFFLAQDRLASRWPGARYAWAACLLLAGVFLLVFSDTEIWPFGYQSFYYAVTHNVEVAQHKTFAAILVALGVVATLRTSGRLRGVWSAWIFPVLALAGATMLLFHHHGGMHGPDAMQTMVRVQHQHLRFAGAGVGVAVAKGLADTSGKWQSFFNKLWPLFMIVLGVMLLMYTE